VTEPINLAEYEALARERLEATAHGYYASGAGDELTLADNQAAFRRLRIHYRVLAGVGARDLRTTALGREVALPVLVAPTAFQRMACPAGEVATARAAGAVGTVMVLSTLSNTPVEDVCAAASGPVWFQLYVYKDRELTKALVARAEAAGCSALVLTVDAPLLGTRERDVRNRFRLPAGLAVANLLPAGADAAALPAGEGSGLAAYVASLLDPDLTWDDLDWLRSITSLPVLVKGVVRGDDAARACERGVAGVIVSNHGGRQLDTAPAAIDVLEEVARAVDGRAEVFVDGGVRRGTDVLKALALGARAVLVGRPVLWGLAAAGQAGAERVLAILRDEVDLALALAGCAAPGDVTRDLVRAGPAG